MEPNQQPGVLGQPFQPDPQMMRYAQLQDVFNSMSGGLFNANPFANNIAMQQRAAQQQQAFQLQQMRLQGLQQRQRQADPFFEFETAKRKGYIPEDMTLADYHQLKFRNSDNTLPNVTQIALGRTQSIENEAAREEGREPRKVTMDDITTDTWDISQRSPYMDSTPAGGLNMVSGTGGVTPIRTPEEGISESANKAGAVKAAEGSAGFNVEGLNTSRSRYIDARDQYLQSEDMMEVIDSGIALFDPQRDGGAIDTGPFVYLLANLLGIGDESVGEFQVLGTDATLEKLQMFKGPTTDFEFTKSELGAFADLFSNEKIGMGRLNEAKRAIERMQRRLSSQAREHYTAMEGYSQDPVQLNAIKTAYPPLDNWGWQMNPAGAGNGSLKDRVKALWNQ